MKAVVVASGDLDPTDQRWLEGADLVVAADGGAIALEATARLPDLLVGDMDSAPGELVERVAASGGEVQRHPVDKEASDTELAVEAAMAAGATDVTVLGATGGVRLDHELANVLMLADPDFATRRIRLVHGDTLIRAVTGSEPLRLDAEEGALVSLLPIGGDVRGVTTEGLRWELSAATLRFGRSRGLSNVVMRAPASVSVAEGTLLVIETSSGGDDQ